MEWEIFLLGFWKDEVEGWRGSSNFPTPLQEKKWTLWEMDRPRTPFSSSNNLGFMPQLHTDAHCFVCQSAHSYILRLGESKDGRKGSYNNNSKASDHLACHRWASRGRGGLPSAIGGRVVGPWSGPQALGSPCLGVILGPGTPPPCDTRQTALPGSPVSLFTEGAAGVVRIEWANTDVENGLVDPGGEGEGGTNRKSSADIETLLRVK